MTTAVPIQANDHLTLSGMWRAYDANGRHSLRARVPGDIHSALLEAGAIPDPYIGTDEERCQWVAREDWLFERDVEVSDELLSAPSIYLNLERLDVLAEVFVNGRSAGAFENAHLRHRAEVKHLLRPGRNTLRIAFRSPAREAARRAAALPYPIPASHHPFLGPRYKGWNLLRKPACHGGWDWGVSLYTCGPLGDVSVRATRTARIEHVHTVQRHTRGRCTVEVAVELFAPAAGRTTVSATLDGRTVTRAVELRGGAQTETLRIRIDSPRLWWPVGQGAQPLYTLEVRAGDEVVSKRIGLRTIEILSKPDTAGRPLTIVVNGRPVFCKGANWIPTDGLPARQTRAVCEDLLRSAVAANMNMLRVWGGGQYEDDFFYELCDELGLLVWHDLMFSCALYPSSPEFLAQVRAETLHQAKRLRDHACIALWCGDNECIGALTWFEESKASRDRYLVDWDRLSAVRGAALAEADPTRVYWPSSPCAGPGDFRDTWHADGHGDMHYWSVWHEDKGFEAYYAIRPRFCSEFGFQSFNSLESVSRYCPPDQWNITSPVMEHHQRNAAGNRRINETFARYFRMPAGFAGALYLSQVQQALAIKTAVEHWRTLRPHCMGTLFWQLNDLWPVASWASIEHGGKWKQLHHHARRFYAPVAAFLTRPNPDTLELWVVNDLPRAVGVRLAPRLLDLDGRSVRARTQAATPRPLTRRVKAGSALRAASWKVADLAAAGDPAERFVHVTLTGLRGGGVSPQETTAVLADWKRMHLRAPRIRAKVRGLAVTLETDAPAFFLTLTAKGLRGEFDDNSLTLLPGSPRTLTFAPKERVTSAALKRALTIEHLQGSYA